MDFPMAQATRDYPSSLGSEALFLSPMNDANILGWDTAQQCLLRGNGYLVNWPLPKWSHQIEWVKTTLVHMVDFVAKAIISQNQRLGTANISWICGRSQRVQYAHTLQDMIREHSIAVFPLQNRAPPLGLNYH